MLCIFMPLLSVAEGSNKSTIPAFPPADMCSNRFDCTAAKLATYSVEYLDHDTSPSDAAAWLNENGYDAAPVYDDSDPVGFIHADDVTTDDDGDTLDDYLTLLTIDAMISGGFCFVIRARDPLENAC